MLALVGAGICAAVAAGLIGLAEDYLTERISQGIIFDLRERSSTAWCTSRLASTPAIARAR